MIKALIEEQDELHKIRTAAAWQLPEERKELDSAYHAFTKLLMARREVARAYLVADGTAKELYKEEIDYINNKIKIILAL